MESTLALPQSRFVVPVMLAASLALHRGLLAALPSARPHARTVETVSFEVVERPPPPPRPAEPARPGPAPRPSAPTRQVRPPPRQTASLPPPNAPAPPASAGEGKPAPLRIGISLASTTTGGSFTVGVGNSLYGRVDEKATDPAAVKPYSAPFVPPTRVSTLPKLLAELKPEYPPEARRAGIEGRVVLMVRIDEAGRVVGVRVIEGPGHGLEDAAAATARKFRFAPATLDGAPVSTEIRFTTTFLLE